MNNNAKYNSSRISSVSCKYKCRENNSHSARCCFFILREKNTVQKRILQLEETTNNSDESQFWDCLKSMDDNVKEKSIPPMSEVMIGRA